MRVVWGGALSVCAAALCTYGIGITGASAQQGFVVAPGDIVVTATRRAENLQDIPVSVTAITREQIEQNRVFTIEDAARLSAGITPSTFNQSAPLIAIRGTTNTFQRAGSDKPVGVFIDDVYVSRYSAADFELFDLERVEILRGPQGTAFGRNVTAGAINIITARPEIGGDETVVKAGFGNYDFREFSALTNFTLSNSTAVRVSGSHREREGYINDRFTGEDLNDIDTGNIRAQVLHKFSDNFEIILSGDYSEDNNNSRGYTYVGRRVGDSVPPSFGNDGNIRTSELGVPQEFDRTIAGTSLRAFYRTGFGEITSITAYRTADAFEEYSFGPGNRTIPGTDAINQNIKKETDKPETFSQEIRLTTPKGKFIDGVAGVFYYNDDTDRTVDDTSFSAPGTLTTFLNQIFDTNAKTESAAVFGTATVHLAPQWDLSLGARYTYEEKEVSSFYRNKFSTADNSADYRASASESFDDLSTRVALSWFATDNVHLFVSRAEGFTAGGFNTEVAAARGANQAATNVNVLNAKTAVETPFDPEKVTSYELGAKTTWLDGRFGVNVTGFYQEYTDKQELTADPTSVVRVLTIANAGEATIQGVELETFMRPMENLSLGFNYTYLDARYDEFIFRTAVTGGGATPQDFSGNFLSTAPRHKFGVVIDYRVPLQQYGSLLFNANYSWQSEYFTGAANSPDFLIDEFGLLNGSVSFVTPDEKTTVSVWGKNIFDTEYVYIRGTLASGGVAGAGGVGEYYGAPATYGVSLKHKF